MKKRTILLIRTATMIIIYISVAYLLIFTPLFKEGISVGIRIVFGIIFVVYGIARGYRLWKE